MIGIELAGIRAGLGRQLRKKIGRASVALLALALQSSWAGAQTIVTVAGTRDTGTTVDGQPATNTRIFSPQGVAFDTGGNLHIADHGNLRIRKVNVVNGLMTIVAGTGTNPATYNGDGISAVSANIWAGGVAVDGAGNFYITEDGAHRIRKVTKASGLISTLAGTGSPTFSGDGGAATSASISNPNATALDAAGNVYIADTGNNRIRKITISNGTISTVAGNGSATFSGDGGAATTASLAGPKGVYVDGAGNIYIADTVNHRVRKVAAATGFITTVAGIGTAGFSGDGGPATAAQLNSPVAVILDAAGNIYISDTFNNRIRRIDIATGNIRTVAGGGNSSAENISATSSDLSRPLALGFSPDGRLHITDSSVHLVRKLLPSVAESPAIGTATAGSGSVSLAFTAPAYDGLSPITGFTATCGAQSATGSSSPIVVTGLAPGTAVTCTVTANNAVGSSAPSASSNSVTPTSNPTTTTLTASGLGSSVFGAPVVLTATVTGSPLPGTVTFFDGGVPIAACGTKTPSSGVAQCSTASLGLGTHSLTAAYSGDTGNGASTSAVVMHNVTALSTTNPTVLWSSGYSVGTEAYGHFPGCAQNLPAPKSMVIDAEGNIFVTGCVSVFGAVPPAQFCDMFTMKVNGATGTIMWLVVSQSAQERDMGGYAITLDPSGNAIVTGYITATVGGRNMYTVKHNGVTGSRVWEAIYEGAGGRGDEGRGVTTDAAGNVIVTGYSADFNNFQTTVRTLKYNGATGAQLWVAGLAGLEDSGMAVGVDAGGNVIVAGYTNDNTSGVDMRTTKLNGATGTSMWSVKYSGNGSVLGIDKALALAIDSAGNAIVSGYSLDAPGHKRMRTIKYDGASGAQLWNSVLSGSISGQDDSFAALTLDNAGNPIITGYTNDLSGGRNMRTAKYNGASGALLWSKLYNYTSTDPDEGYAVAVDSTGTVTVTGYSLGASSNQKIRTVQYDAAGTQQWALEDSDSGRNYGQAIAIGANSAVYVYGTTDGDTSPLVKLQKIVSPQPSTYTITVSRSGPGTVTSNPSGISCGADCTEAYATGTQVVLTATPDMGATFANWSGCDSVSGNQCTLLTNAARAPMATFAGSVNLLSVVSRKTHGAAGDFNLNIDTRAAISGNVTVEPRVGASGHKIVFVFDGAVSVAGTASAVNGSGANVAGVTQSALGNEVIVNLPVLPNGSRATVTLTGVNGGAQVLTASIGFLIGDVDGSRTVIQQDTSAIKARSGQGTTLQNARYDINASGLIGSADVSATKARLNATLP